MDVQQKEYFAPKFRQLEKIGKINLYAGSDWGGTFMVGCSGEEFNKIKKKRAESNKGYRSIAIALSTEFHKAGYTEQQWYNFLSELKLCHNGTKFSWRPEIENQADLAYFTDKMMRLGDLFNTKVGNEEIEQPLPVFPKDATEEQHHTMMRAWADLPRNVFEQTEKELQQEFLSKGYSYSQFYDLMEKCGVEDRIERPVRIM